MIRDSAKSQYENVSGSIVCLISIQMLQEIKLRESESRLSICYLLVCRMPPWRSSSAACAAASRAVSNRNGEHDT
jgi:hypothetical protein